MQARSVGLTAASLARLISLNPSTIPLVIGQPVTGGTVFGVLWEDAAGKLASGPVLTNGSGVTTIPSGGSLAIGGATIGTDALGVTGTATFSGVVTTGAGSASTSGATMALQLGAGSGVGMYNTGANSIALGALGIDILRSSATSLRAGAGAVIGLTSAAAGAAADTGLSRISAGVWGMGTGAAGSVAGTLQVANITMTAAGVLQLGNARAAGVLVQGGSVTMKDSGGNTITVLTT